MDLKKYLEGEKGFGIIATSDSNGNVNTAVYARPQITENNKASFVMREKKTYVNIKDNPHANYMFIANVENMTGIRMYLSYLEETSDPEIINKFRRRNSPAEEQIEKENLHLVTFEINKVLKLIGSAEFSF